MLCILGAAAGFSLNTVRPAGRRARAPVMSSADEHLISHQTPRQDHPPYSTTVRSGH
jgi:hypothetical protein